MPRIAGVNIPDQKQIKIALTYIYGIGVASAEKVLLKANIDPSRRTKDLSLEDINHLKEIIVKEYKIEGDLRKDLMMNIKRLKDIRCWRGIRHIKGLPVRGQRTKTNSRTVRGNVRKTVGSGRKAAPAAK